jgi:hypothetical protein
MAHQISLETARKMFPGAVESIDPEDLQAYAPDDDEAESELWVHNDTLYSRTWWTAYGWHYGVWMEGRWACPPDGEVVCPWTGERS